MNITVNVEALKAELRGPYATRIANELGDAFIRIAQRHVPRATGAGAESITRGEAQADANGASVLVTVGAEYLRYQEEGTGIYGPTGQRIYPITAKALVFDWPKAGGVVFFKSVAGVRPNHWWSRTLEAWGEVVSAA